MKEFIEKLIGRLEEQEEYETDGKNYNAATAYANAIEIVNEIAKEYKKESGKGDLISRSDVMEMLTNIELSCTVIPITEAKIAVKRYSNSRQ